MTHTKGPWSVRMPTEFLNQAAIEPCIGCVYGAGEELRANANLIASAPELLEAVQALVDWSEEQTKLSFYDRMMQFNAALDKASAAIAKAKGEV